MVMFYLFFVDIWGVLLQVCKTCSSLVEHMENENDNDNDNISLLLYVLMICKYVICKYVICNIEYVI